MQIEVDQMNPRVLRAERFNFYEADALVYQLMPRRCFNYELELFSAPAGVIIGGDYVEFKPGEINLRRPGQVVCGVPPYWGYVICFSLGQGQASPEGYIFGTPEKAEPDYNNPLLNALPTKIIPPKQEEVRSLFKQMAALYIKQDTFSRFGEIALLHQLLHLLFATVQNTAQEPMNPKVLAAAAHIRAHYVEDLKIGALIAKAGLSKAYFHRCFRACTGTTPARLVIKLRMERAKTLLQLTQDSVGGIAAACGYLDNVYFTHLFHKYVGLSPTAYRKSLQE